MNGTKHHTRHGLTDGDRFNIGARTHRRTYEIIQVHRNGDITVELVDQAVGYDYAQPDPPTHRFVGDAVSECVNEDGSISAKLVKTVPDGIHIVPQHESES